MASDACCGFSRSTIRPDSPDFTISVNPGASDTTTGQPTAIASTTATPKLSARESATNTSKELMTSGKWSCTTFPSNTIFSASPKFIACNCNFSLSLPSPTIRKHKFRSGRRLHNRAKASINVSIPYPYSKVFTIPNTNLSVSWYFFGNLLNNVISTPNGVTGICFLSVYLASSRAITWLVDKTRSAFFSIYLITQALLHERRG